MLAALAGRLVETRGWEALGYARLRDYAAELSAGSTPVGTTKEARSDADEGRDHDRSDLPGPLDLVRVSNPQENGASLRSARRANGLGPAEGRVPCSSAAKDETTTAPQEIVKERSRRLRERAAASAAPLSPQASAFHGAWGGGTS